MMSSFSASSFAIQVNEDGQGGDVVNFIGRGGASLWATAVRVSALAQCISHQLPSPDARPTVTIAVALILSAVDALALALVLSAVGPPHYKLGTPLVCT